MIDRLAELDGPADEAGVWPEALWSVMVEAGAQRWGVPERFGGDGLRQVAMVKRQSVLAEASLTAAFIQSQFHAATRRLIAAADQEHDRAADWWPAIAEGFVFPTIGASQLTTSKRRGGRAMVAEPTGDGGYRLDGQMPWVTAAERADLFVTGGVLDDGQQVLVALPADRPGIEVGSPMPLAALQASCTTEVQCAQVPVERGDVLFGPDPNVMAKATGGGAGGLETSTLALGQARAALRALRGLAPVRDNLDEPLEALESSWVSVAEDLLAVAEQRPNAPDPADVRKRANAEVLRSTQAYLTARKGTGFLRTEPAQRWARQALFFLVWSCPGPVAQAALREFADLCTE